MNKAIIYQQSEILVQWDSHSIPTTHTNQILALIFFIVLFHLFIILFILKRSPRCFPFGSYCSLPRGSLPLNSLDLDTHHCDNNKVFPSSTASLSFQCSWWCHWCVQRAKLVCFFFLFSSFCPPLLTTSQKYQLASCYMSIHVM